MTFLDGRKLKRVSTNWRWRFHKQAVRGPSFVNHWHYTCGWRIMRPQWHFMKSDLLSIIKIFWLKRNETTTIHDWYCFFLWFQVLWRRCILFYWNTLHCYFKHRNQCIQVFIIFSGTCHDFSVDFLSFYNLAQCSEDGVYSISTFIFQVFHHWVNDYKAGVYSISIFIFQVLHPLVNTGGNRLKWNLLCLRQYLDSKHSPLVKTDTDQIEKKIKSFNVVEHNRDSRNKTW